MEIIRPFEVITNEEAKEAKMKNGLNIDFFRKGVSIADNTEPTEDTSTTKKRGRPKKETLDGVVLANSSTSTPSTYLNNGAPYEKSFEETTNMLKNSIYQIDTLNNEVHSELENVRNSKTLKGRYTYISDLTSTSSSLLTTKISAIREINNSIKEAHKLELDRQKALKVDVTADNDDAKIQAMYSAYINTPISSGYNPLAFDTQSAMMPATSGLIMSDMGQNSQGASIVTPEQNRMLMEDNPNIKTVVVYDQNNPNRRFFDVIDTTTGQSVPNYPRPDPIFLEETSINPVSGIAHNSNINMTWPVMVIGDPNMSEF